MENSKSSGRFCLPADATIRHADDLHRALISTIAQHTSVVADCSAIREADLSAVQLLLAARRSATAQGKHLALAAPASGALLAVLERAGMLAPNSPEDLPDADFWLTGVDAQ